MLLLTENVKHVKCNYEILVKIVERIVENIMR